MNSRMNRSEGTGEPGDHIWLRYGTQFTLNGRTHTIEMSIPMPIGADEVTREQLLREADAGMNQLSDHVENRVAQMMQRAQPNQGKLPTPTPLARSSPQTRPASIPAQQTGPQPLQAAPARTYEGAEPVAPVARTREKEPEAPPAQEAVAAPITRSDIGASMPSIPPGESGGNLSLQQFIGYIRENMGLNPKQAMDILKIKTLSGVNLREALEQLQKVAPQENPAPTGVAAKAQENTPPARPASGPVAARNTPPSPPPTLSSLRSPGREVERGGRGDLNEHSSPYAAFDEEVEPDEGEELDDLEDLDLPRELSAQERVQARNKIDSMRETRGATVSSPGRLQVLTNITSSQISPQQLQELIEGVWSVNSIKKLKVDQTEMLISWAKEDDFVSEVEAVLTILEEG